MANIPKYIIVHHSAIPGAAEQFDKINDSHKRRGFPISRLGFYGGYHRLIERSGKIMTYREDDEVGAHTVAYWPPYIGMNYKSIGICLAGDFTKEQVDMDQLRSLRSLLDQYQGKYGIPDEKVLLHRQVKATACPGTDVLYLLESVAGLAPDYERQLRDAEMQISDPAVSAVHKRMLARRIVRLKTRLDEHAKAVLADAQAE